MNKKITATAYHEAGHVVALLLTKRRFKDVTIKPSKGKDGSELDTLGSVRTMQLKFKVNGDPLYFLQPSSFKTYFISNFFDVAGVVAERIYTGRFNNIGFTFDFKQLADLTLYDLPEKLRGAYIKFLFEYTKDVLTWGNNWFLITAIAEALLEKKTLNYDEVIAAVERGKKMYYQSFLELSKREIEPPE